ncbi:MAG: heavy-metal-associated domain-containing protein [Pseudomonadota bacterium]
MKTIKIEGMSCNHCVAAVTKALDSVDGVKDLTVDLKKGEAVFSETKPVDDAELKRAVEKAGFSIG